MSMIHHRRHPHKPEKKMSLGPFKMITCSHFHKASSTILTGDTDIEPPLHMYSATSANPKNPCSHCRDCSYSRDYSHSGHCSHNRDKYSYYRDCREAIVAVETVVRVEPVVKVEPVVTS